MSFWKKLAAPFQKAVKQSVSSFIALETAHNETTLVGNDGSLISYLKVSGSRQLIGQEEYDHIVEAATIKVGARFDRLGHAMQVYFARDPYRIDKVLKHHIQPSKIAAKNIGIEVEDVLNERTGHLSKFLTHEEAYFVLWTRPAVLTKNEVKNAGTQAKEKAKTWVNASQAQYPLAAMEPLDTRHKSYVGAMMAAMNEIGIQTELMESHDACLLYTSPSPRDQRGSRMPSSA